MNEINPIDAAQAAAFTQRVRTAVMWRAGSQIAAQLVMWGATIIVVRLLDPSDYGLFAMTQVVLVALNILNGDGFATSLIQAESLDNRRIGQVFGMLLLLNGMLALALFLLAPLAAAYFNQPLVAHMLRVQCFLFLSTPFIALPTALLARRMDFRQQGWINLTGALAGAVTALSCAVSGLGVWTLVIAPLVMFWTRALGLTVAARLLVRPVFDFRGSSAVVRFGTALLFCQLLWIVQSQADIVIAGRAFDPHDLGLYSESLFIALILTGRFVPPINEVALPAYAQLIKSGRSAGPAFIATARMIMLVVTPAYVGLSLSAPPFVATVLGPKWLEMIPILAGLALAMPFMALQIICSPTTNAMGRPRIYLQSSLAGAVIMPVAYLVGIQWGPQGLVHAWQIAAPLLLAITLSMTLPVVGARWSALAAAMLPVAVATGVMAATVLALTALVAPLVPPAQLVILIAGGALAYGATLRLGWPELVRALMDLVRGRVSVPGLDDQTTHSPAPGAG